MKQLGGKAYLCALIVKLQVCKLLNGFLYNMQPQSGFFLSFLVQSSQSSFLHLQRNTGITICPAVILILAVLDPDYTQQCFNPIPQTGGLLLPQRNWISHVQLMLVWYFFTHIQDFFCSAVFWEPCFQGFSHAFVHKPS